MVRLFDTVRWLDDRARQLDGYQDAAATAFRESARRLEADLRAQLAELLPLPEAAAKYAWNYEALRRKVAENPELIAGSPGSRPMVTRATMEMLGPGRGPRTIKSGPAAEQGTDEGVCTLAQVPRTAAPLDSRFEGIMRRATASRRRNA